jgi:preprotein translocase subunit SecD
LNFKKFFTIRVWILIVAIILALIAISPNPWAEGIEVSSIDSQSELAGYGLSIGDEIYSIGDYTITSITDVSDALESYQYDSQEISVETSGGEISYIITNDLGFILNESLVILSSETEGVEINSVLEKINDISINSYEDYELVLDELLPKQSIKIESDEGLIAYLSREVPDFSVGEADTSNLVYGLDFTGGTRVLLQPVSNDEEITDDDISTLIDVLSNRLNVYGLSDMKIRSAEDWEGNKYVLVEIAGVTETEVRDLISQQGKFEAKVGDVLVFEGGENDIVYVCRNDGTCSGVRTCDEIEGGTSCQFQFAITLSQDAANLFAGATENLDIVVSEDGGGSYLNETIDFYLDGELVDSLNIASSLKGQTTTSIAISGPGYGLTQNDALDDALSSMNTLQTILITGSLPFDIEVAKIDTVSPILGESFLRNALLVGLIAILSVAVVLYLRYRQIKVVIPVLIAMLSELFLILGFAAVVQWNLDMAAIAGIIAAVGTGVDDQIVILDETVNGEDQRGNWKDKIKKAFFIIFVAYATTVAAMIPLWNAGAGLIRGFAVTIIAGVTIGVFLTRPAFASLVEKLYQED